MNDTTEPQSYEANYQRLQDLVLRLERDKLGLEESLSLFEEGISLARLCDLQLSKVEDRIKVLITDSQALSSRGDLPLDALHVTTASEDNHV